MDAAILDHHAVHRLGGPGQLRGHTAGQFPLPLRLRRRQRRQRPQERPAAHIRRRPDTQEERGTGIQRGFEGYADEAVFPGLDENNDFISDFNQNNTRVRPNNVPDYAEPFLRYSVDRPEYLFGLDMNNNGWGDRFENDNEPDYPLQARPPRGFNVYGSAWIVPSAKITAGHQRVRRPSTGETNVSSYTLFAFERSYPNVGELTVYNMLKRVEDDIADDLFQWLHGRFRDAVMTPIPDPLGMPNTWVNKLSLTFERRGHAGINSEKQADL